MTTDCIGTDGAPATVAKLQQALRWPARLLDAATDKDLCRAGLAWLRGAEKQLAKAHVVLNETVPDHFFRLVKSAPQEMPLWAEIMECAGKVADRVPIEDLAKVFERMQRTAGEMTESIVTILCARQILEELPAIRRLNVGLEFKQYVLSGPAGQLVRNWCTFDHVGFGQAGKILLIEELKSNASLKEMLNVGRAGLHEQWRKYLSFLIEYPDVAGVKSFRWRILDTAGNEVINAGSLGSGRGADLLQKTLLDEGVAWIGRYRAAAVAKQPGALSIEVIDAFEQAFRAHAASSKFVVLTKL